MLPFRSRTHGLKENAEPRHLAELSLCLKIRERNLHPARRMRARKDQNTWLGTNKETRGWWIAIRTSHHLCAKTGKEVGRGGDEVTNKDTSFWKPAQTQALDHSEPSKYSPTLFTFPMLGQSCSKVRSSTQPMDEGWVVWASGFWRNMTVNARGKKC